MTPAAGYFPEPLYATQPTPGSDTDLWRARAIGNAINLPLIPWQEHVLRVGLERTTQGKNRYSQIVGTVPRRNGKTIILLNRTVDVLAFSEEPDQRAIWSGQRITDVVAKWRNEIFRPLARALDANLGIDPGYMTYGLADARWDLGERGTCSLEGLSPKAGHGSRTNLICCDEAWADLNEDRSTAYVPTGRGVPGWQMLIMSTVGGAEHPAVWLDALIHAGRERVLAGARTRSAYFEWGGPRDHPTLPDCDWEDRQAWADANPALNYLFSMDDLETDFDSYSPSKKEEEVRRNILNQPPVRDIARPAIPWEIWDAALTLETTMKGRIVIAVDAPPERSMSTVVQSDGTRVEVLERRPGVGWVAEWLIRNAKTARVAEVVGMSGGPANGALQTALDNGVKIGWYRTADARQAAPDFADAVAAEQAIVVRDPCWHPAIAGGKREESGGAHARSWIWRRIDETVDISPLWAASMALHRAKQHQTRPVDATGYTTPTETDSDHATFQQMMREWQTNSLPSPPHSD